MGYRAKKKTVWIPPSDGKGSITDVANRKKYLMSETPKSVQIRALFWTMQSLGWNDTKRNVEVAGQQMFVLGNVMELRDYKDVSLYIQMNYWTKNTCPC